MSIETSLREHSVEDGTVYALCSWDDNVLLDFFESWGFFFMDKQIYRTVDIFTKFSLA